MAAAHLDLKSCPLALSSMKAANPAHDVLQRINYVLSNLTLQSFYDQDNNQTYTFDSTISMVSRLSFPNTWNLLAQELLDIETVIHTSLHRRSETNLSFSSFDASNPLSGIYNPFVYPAILCLDTSYANIRDPETFVEYVSNQIAENSLVGYQGVEAAWCLSWPNLTTYNIEKYTAPFTQLHNKILIIAETNNPGTFYNGVLATYEYIGEDNANLLVHDAFGYGVISDPNKCTLNAIKTYYKNGTTLENEANLGTLPPNGTFCHTDHGGVRNIFIKNLSEHGSGDFRLKLGLGLGFGLGFGLTLLVGLFITAFLSHRRRRPRNETQMETRVDNFGDEKDKSLFAE